jgi:hypothetical protein
MKNADASAVLDRIVALLNASDDSEASRTLGVQRSTWGGWRSRQSIPYELCVRLAEDEGICLDWLLTGAGPVRRSEILTRRGPDDPAEGRLLAIFRGLDDSDKPLILEEASKIERLGELRTLRRRVAELEAAIRQPPADGAPGAGIREVPLRVDMEAIPDRPGKPFLVWLAQGLRGGRLSCNAKGARVHVVDAGVLLASPGIFRDYAASGGEAEPWETIQHRFQRLDLHVRGRHGENIHRYAVAGTGHTVQGYLLPNARILFGSDPPPPNTRLHRCPSARLSHP